MREIDPHQARTLATIISTGSFEAAAAALSVTASAVSQRIRALETAVGRPVLRRTRPVELTDAGQAVVRFARQLELLSADVLTELGSDDPAAGRGLTIVINADSLNTWALAALAPLALTLQLEVLREDQEHSLELLRNGAAAAAITSTGAPIPGCSAQPLGVMRYLPVCTAEFRREWFADGVTPAALTRAPVIVFDRKDDLQDRYLRGRGVLSGTPPRHYIPAAHEFGEAIALGMGWGLLPELELARDSRRRSLAAFDAGTFVDVPLHWQQWRHGSAALDEVAATIRGAAAVLR
ncbi:ArgP/LysG family DNA-binding transcriptional regulator [Arthrobacter zhaoguopingii]|uniref:ArgP/LysG family DNA-binding transcriptional regulator n=1 Tax=Arthrobacter zhaoguopingii TaxID=2681491 RepID=UPI00135B4D7D|nr:ArgP/LysG family DNA-binding transcriptional regulator [Arthrobacter zhaoguopingii]